MVSLLIWGHLKSANTSHLGMTFQWAMMVHLSELCPFSGWTLIATVFAPSRHQLDRLSTSFCTVPLWGHGRAHWTSKSQGPTGRANPPPTPSIPRGGKFTFQ